MFNRIQSLLIIKPDGVARGLIGQIVTRFEQKGFRLVGSKMVNATPDLLAKHYPEHFGKDYYPSIEKSMTAGPMFVFVLEGPDGTVEYIRKMLGATNPMKADVGTIRGDLAIDYGHNVCHASDSVEAAKREISVWFKEEELAFYKNSIFTS
jgi:nucleoside-diphosphate kinase